MLSIHLNVSSYGNRGLEINRREKMWQCDLSFKREWNGDGHKVTEMGGIWYKKYVSAHLYPEPTGKSEPSGW